jgi:DNA-binding MarR family transcriptional regulator
MEIQRYCAYDKLMELALQMVSIHPDIHTVNPHEYCYQLPENVSNQKSVALYNLLIHGLTCLHHRQREITLEGKYISEEEDNITALSLVQQILPLPEFTLSCSEISLYKTLYEVYGNDKVFTMKEIVYRRYYKAETTKRIIKKLKKMGILKATGNRYKGYEYWIEP